MHLPGHIALRRHRPEGRRPRRGAHPEPRPVRRDAPRDRAFYTCPCGFAWTGAVTTSVACPHCGAGQAW